MTVCSESSTVAGRSRPVTKTPPSSDGNASASGESVRFGRFVAELEVVDSVRLHEFPSRVGLSFTDASQFAERPVHDDSESSRRTVDWVVLETEYLGRVPVHLLHTSLWTNDQLIRFYDISVVLLDGI